MRLKSVFISQYKNLRNFELTFDGTSFLDVFVGKNGSGKSNLFEALIEIFRHLVEFGGAENPIGFDYRIRYEIDGTETSIAWEKEKLTINGRERKTLGRTPLPENILVYYSGHNDTVRELVDRYETAFRKRIKGADLTESRRFYGIRSDYKSLLLAMLLMRPEGNAAREYVRQKLGIERLGMPIPGSRELTEPVIRLTLLRPGYAIGKHEFDIEANDESDRYWKAAGITRDFLNILTLCVESTPGNMSVNQGYFPTEGSDYYILYLSLRKLQAQFQELRPQNVFRMFDNLRTLGMLAEISIPLRLADGLDGDSGIFSDGQFQSVYIYAIAELFKDRNCITLLDEPDAFLHPEWQFDFLKQVIEISEAATAKNHVLMSSHSAATITKASDGQIRMVEIDGNRVITKQASKSEIIQSLSGGAITFSATEARLSIDYVLQNSTGAILFTEGITDKLILEAAWAKLYPGTTCRFEIQNTFGCGFLRALFKDQELKNHFPARKMFALFDFDEAYNEWKGLKKGRDEVTDPFAGLAKQLEYEHHYALLVPVPHVEVLKKHALDNSGKPWPRPCLSIELLFFSEDLIGQCFRRCAVPGSGEIIEFYGDKVAFAKDRIPRMPAANFEPLRSMLDFVTSKCGA